MKYKPPVILALVQGLGIFLYGEDLWFLLFALWQIFCICRLKLLILSRIIPNSSTVSDVMVFLSKEVFLSMFLYLERNTS